MNYRPGGKAPQFLAHILLKYVAVGSDKFNLEDNGFDGFGVNAEIIKSRVNQAGQSVYFVYDKIRGIDPIRSTIAYAKEMGLTGGNKNKFYFLDHKDKSFSLVNVRDEFRERKELWKIMYDTVKPPLQARLSTISQEEMSDIPEESMDY